MGYPRKSYPHRCPPPCAKRSRPRACARVYKYIVRPRAAPEKSPRRCATVSRAAERRVGEGEGKGGRPLAQCRTCRLCAESPSAKAECTRRTPPLPVRSPRESLSTPELPPADGRITVRNGGRRRQRRTPPRTATRPCLPTAAPPPPKWAPRHRRREGKRPNGAPPHRTAHTPNAERKRYLHNSRTKTQRRTKRCAQFVIFVFTPCKLLHNFSTVLHRSPRNVLELSLIHISEPTRPY